MTYRWLDHTSELGLEVEAADEAAVLSEALTALGEVLRSEEGRPDVAEVRRALDVEAGDLATLLAECMTEAVFLAETEGLVPLELSDVELEPRRLRATLLAHRAPTSPLVKAVTYHDLRFERTADGWRAHVVLDV
jgi:SHS2 domain-containing protein